jgi:succinoglycan biosynthesis transport protein ExoP
MDDKNFSAQNEGSSEKSLRDVFDIIFRRKVIVLVVVLLSLATAFVLALLPRDYTATGSIRIQPGMESMYSTSPLMSMLGGDSADKIESDTVILQSRTLYLRVAQELNLVNDPTFWGKKHMTTQSIDDPKVKAKLLRLMSKKIKVEHNPKDEIVDISCTTIDPALSSKIVNTLINDYVAYLFQIRYGATQRASAWLIEQLKDLKEQVGSDQSALTQLQGKLGIIGLDDKTSNFLSAESLDAMTKAESDATIARIIAEAKLKFLKESDPNLIEGETNVLSQGTMPTVNPQNGLLQSLRISQAQSAANYAHLLAQYGPNYPDVKQAKAQLDEITGQVKTEQERILNQAEIAYGAAKSNEEMTSQTLSQKKDEVFSSSGDMVKYVILLHDYESHRALYEELIQRLREAGITSGMEAGEIDVVDLADIPGLPVPPGPLLLFAGFGFAGIIAGCFVAIGVDALDTRVSTQEQAGQAMGIPMLSMIPHMKYNVPPGGKTDGQVPPLAAPGSHFAEAIQSLRTAILLTQAGSPPRVILVTSAVPGEGKSTTARNLAAGFARHHARVLLIDCDLRKGTLSKALGLTVARGVSNVLTNQEPFEASVQKVPGTEGLFALASGPYPPDPAVLTGSSEMSKLIESCSNHFDFVILDSAPVLGLSDTINLGQFAEAIVQVVREKMSNRRAIRSAAMSIKAAHLPLIGFVINDVDPHNHFYGYGYDGYYSKGYYRNEAEVTK